MHQTMEIGGRYRAAEEEALALIDAQGPEQAGLPFALDSFGDRIEPKRLGHGDDGICDGDSVGVVRQVTDERYVDLERVDG
jgi:hypothetical protein